MYNRTNQSIYPVRSNDVLTGQKIPQESENIDVGWKAGKKREREKKILCEIEFITMRSAMVFENMNVTRRMNEQMTEYVVYEIIRTKTICNFYEMLRKM